MSASRNFFIVFYSLFLSNVIFAMNNPLIKGFTIEGQSILSRPSFSSDGTKIATLFKTDDCTEPDIFSIINIQTGESEYSFDANKTIYRGYFNPFSPEIFFHAYNLKNSLSKMEILRYPSFATVMRCENSYCHEVPTDIIWSADGRLRLVHYTFKDIMWDNQENRELYTMESDQRFKKFSPDGRQAIFTRPSLQVRDARTNALLAEISDAKYPSEVAINQDGSRIAANLNLLVHVWETTTPYRKLFTLNGHLDTITRLEYSPDGRRIITGADDGRVILWDAETGEKIKIISHRNEIKCVAFNPKRPLLLSLAHDAVKISNTITGDLIYEISADSDEINYAGIVNEFVSEAVFSPDGQHILTGIFNFTAGRINSTLWTIPDFYPAN